jgi:ABC-type Fe3+-siderophore transport system permease subunit
MPLPLLLADQSTVVIHSGIGLGSVIAVVCSWQRNRSIMWGILHGIFSWFYVIYFAYTRKPEEMK